MILLTILALIVVFMLMFSIGILSMMGAAGIIIFADIIVCVLVIGWIIKKIIKKRRS